MKINSVIKSSRLYFRNLDNNDDLSGYLNWMQDVVNHRFILGVNKKNTIEALEQYIELNNQSSNCLLFGIFSINSKLHIGNIRLMNIDNVNKQAYLGILIGESDFKQQGVGYESVTRIMKWACEELGIKTFKLGCDIMNKPALQLYKKLGFRTVSVKWSRCRISLIMCNNNIASKI